MDLQNLGPQNSFVSTVFRKTYHFLSSAKLAMAVLVAILASCVLGVTVFRGGRANALIFGTLWFNGLLVLLVVNICFCFFGRIWSRKVTLISFGMILFHLSFVAILIGIIDNSLFYFRGLIRLTEGETLSSGDTWSYDMIDNGRFFSYSKLKGETTLIKLHKGYKVDGVNKRVAYEVAVGEGGTKKQGIIYITNSLDHNGFSYLADKEGYTVLVVLYDNKGREIYGAFIPLQSFKQKDNSYLYTTGTRDGPGSFPFPQGSPKPMVELQVTYRPSKIGERTGEAVFQIRPLGNADPAKGDKHLAEGKAAIGEKFRAGNYSIEAREIRYWVGMTVRYEPGKPVVLTSLWVGLGGMVITFIGRMRRRGKGKRLTAS